MCNRKYTARPVIAQQEFGKATFQNETVPIKMKRS